MWQIKLIRALFVVNICYIKISLVNILEMVFVFIEILFKNVLFKGGVLIYAEHCMCAYLNMCVSQQQNLLIAFF